MELSDVVDLLLVFLELETRVSYSQFYIHVILKYIVMTALGIHNIFNIVVFILYENLNKLHHTL